MWTEPGENLLNEYKTLSWDFYIIWVDKKSKYYLEKQKHSLSGDVKTLMGKVKTLLWKQKHYLGR